MRARLIALAKSVLSRLGLLRRRPLAPVLALPLPVPAPMPLSPRATRCTGLLGVPGCNREGGAP